MARARPARPNIKFGSRSCGAECMRIVLVLTVALACAYGKRGGLRQKNRRSVEAAAAEAVEAATAADAGEVVDPLGYYRYRWQEPTDTCGTELHADYDGTRAWNWGLARCRVDMHAAHRGAGLLVGGCRGAKGAEGRRALRERRGVRGRRAPRRGRVEHAQPAQGSSRCIRWGLACAACMRSEAHTTSCRDGHKQATPRAVKGM